MERRNESMAVAGLLIVGSGLIAVFQVAVLGRDLIRASMGFVWGVIVAVIVASIIDATDRPGGSE
jgi:hypothetical protein